jgi:tetratricopeptide (TPR) repeat protein
MYVFAVFFLITGGLFAQTRVADSLKHLLSQEMEDSTRVLLLAKTSFEYSNIQADTAIRYAEEGLKLAQRLEYKKGEVEATGTYARCLSTLGNFPKAIEMGLKSLRMAEESGDESEVAFAQGQLADMYRDAGEYELALGYSLKSLAYFQRANQSFSSALGSFGKILFAVTASIYERAGKYDSGLVYAQKAYDLDVMETGGRFGWLTLQLGKIHAGLKHPDLALAYYRHAIPLVLENNTHKDLLEAYNSIARLYEDVGNTDSSIQYARESLLHGSPSAYEKGILEALTILTENYKARQSWDSTFKYLQMSVDLRDRMYGQQQEREVQSLSFIEQLRQQDLAIAKGKAEKERRQNLQMLGIGIFIVIFISGVAILSRKRPVKFVRFLGIVGVLLVFEFISLLTHPWIEERTNHTPVYSLLLLVLIAAILGPIHHFFEGLVKKSKSITRPALRPGLEPQE